jgi:lysophospholipase L1-like esterase
VSKRVITSDMRSAPEGRAFAGLTATLRRGHRSACVAMIGDSTGDGYNAGQVSQPVDEWPQVFVKKLGAAFPGYTVLERRWNDTAQGYDPAVTYQDGTGNGGGERAAVFTIATPGSLQYTGTAATGALDVHARIAPTTWVAAPDRTIAARWESTGGNRSWLLLLRSDGSLGLNWSTAGTAGFGQKNSTATIPATANPGDGNPLWVRATLTLDNGATGCDVKFYYSTDGATWTQLGTTVTTAGVTTLFGGTAPYQIGSFTTGLSTPFAGKVHGLRVYGVIGGKQSLVPPLPDDWDWLSAESTVAFTGAPVLSLLNGSASGQNVAYFDNATRRPIVHQPFGQSVVMISTAHNDGTQSRRQWLDNFHTMITNIKTLVPYVPILVMGQNPTAIGSLVTAQQGIELRAARSAILQQYAASQAGVHCFDAWPLVSAADTSDGLHPTAGPGSGSEKWGLALYRALTA